MKAFAAITAAWAAAAACFADGSGRAQEKAVRFRGAPVECASMVEAPELLSEDQ
ncbi:hypothetical protein [Pseudoxanthomonas wuyuanensis]